MSPNFRVLNNSLNPAYDSGAVSNVIKYARLTAGSNTLTWTPASGKRIYLTRIVITTGLSIALTININRSSTPIMQYNFLIGGTNSINNTFSSPLVFNQNEAVSVTANLILVETMDVTLAGYESRV